MNEDLESLERPDVLLGSYLDQMSSTAQEIPLPVEFVLLDLE